MQIIKEKKKDENICLTMGTVNNVMGHTGRKYFQHEMTEQFAKKEI